MKESNLQKTILRKERCWNPYFVDLGSNCYELSNIIIYNDDGILIETNCGWFNESNNHTENPIINGECIKAKKGTEEKHFLQHDNFILKDTSCDYKEGYALYLYYKNINYKVLGIEKKSLFVEVDYTLFNNDEKIYSKAIGQSNKFSDSIYWELRKEIKATDEDGFKYDRSFDELKKHLKNINKLMKKYETIKEAEKNYPIDTFIAGTNTVESTNIEIYRNNKKIMEDKKNEI